MLSRLSPHCEIWCIVSLMRRNEALNQSMSSSNPVRAMPISPGIALGPASLYRATTPTVGETKINPTLVGAEQQRLQAAISAAREELEELQAHVTKTVGSHEAAIFEAHHLMLEDPDLVEEAREIISTHLFSAGAALAQVAERLARELEVLANQT